MFSNNSLMNKNNAGIYQYTGHFKFPNTALYLNFVFNKFFHYLYYYPTSLNINYFWNLGFCSGVFYGIQVLSGFILTFHYAPNIESSFDSIQFIMREVNYGWLYRYVHCNCCSFFFMFVYLHMIRSVMTTSFSYPRNNVWFSGVVIYLLMMASAFLGYVLPWGQMSYWAASVITNLLGSIPILGGFLAYMIWGGYGISNDTLVRFYSLHYLLPLVLAIFVFYHIYFLHFYKSSNPLALYSVHYMKINFHPYFWIKDLFSLCAIFFIFFFILFYYPELFNHSDNYIEANPLVTPHHIVPEWYLLPFYGILKSFTNRLVGVIFMFVSILSLCLLFVIDFGHNKRGLLYNYSKLSNQDFIVSLFVMNFIYLGYLGMLVSSDYTHHFGLILSHLHFYYIYLMYVADSNYIDVINSDLKSKKVKNSNNLSNKKQFVFLFDFFNSTFKNVLTVLKKFIYIPLLKLNKDISLHLNKNINKYFPNIKDRVMDTYSNFVSKISSNTKNNNVEVSSKTKNDSSLFTDDQVEHFKGRISSIKGTIVSNTTSLFSGMKDKSFSKKMMENVKVLKKEKKDNKK